MEPGCILEFDGKNPKHHNFWSLSEYSTSGSACSQNDEEHIVDELEHVLSQSVADCMVSDVPIGALLSGGVDSTLIALLMQKMSHRPIRTFTIGFPQSEFDEAPAAGMLASILGTQHTELYIDSKMALDVIPNLPEIYDEPFADSSAIPTSIVCRLTRRHVKVALSGDGADEQFAGYVRYWMTTALSEKNHSISCNNS